MDKYKQLQTDIESAIAKIDAEIERKQEEISSLDGKISSVTENIEENKRVLDNVNEKIETVKDIENKNIILYIIKKCLSDLIQETKEYIKNKDWFLAAGNPLLIIVLIVFCQIYILGTGLSGFLSLAAIFSAIFIGSNASKILGYNDLKKNYTFRGLSEKRENLINNIDSYNKEIIGYKSESEQLLAEIKKLQDDRAYFASCLEEITEKREQALAQVAAPLLDGLFAKEETSEVIARIRAREKKEGEE